MSNSSSASESQLVGLQTQLADAERRLKLYKHWSKAIRTVCRDTANGRLDARLTQTADFPELTDTLLAVNDCLDMNYAYVKESAAALLAASEKRFHRVILLKGLKGEFRIGAQSINRSVLSLSDADEEILRLQAQRAVVAEDFSSKIGILVSTLAGTAEELGATAEQIQQNARSASQLCNSSVGHAKRVSQLMEEANHAALELGHSIEKSSKTLVTSNAASEKAFSNAANCGQTIQELGGASRAIDDVTSLIKSVAQQTNLLALNATIEAARAGDVGKGFAVVAAEVKNLAKQTGQATQKVGEQVVALQEGVSAVESSMSEINASIKNMNTANQAMLEHSHVQDNQRVNIDQCLTEATEQAQTFVSELQQVLNAAELNESSATQLRLAAREVANMTHSLQDAVHQVSKAL